MPKFIVRRGRDAWAIEETIVEAETAAQAEEWMTWNTYARQAEWVSTGEVRTFDDTEVMEGETKEVSDDHKIEETKTLEVTIQERNTILAALRFWQSEESFIGIPPEQLLALLNIATNGQTHPLLKRTEIDSLCEEINV